MELRGWIFALGPVVLAAILFVVRRNRFRFRPFLLLAYLITVTILIGGAMALVAWIAGARLPLGEVALVVWFAIGIRLTWEVWRRTVGRLGERWVRWERRRRRRGRGVLWLRLIPAARWVVVAVVLAPLFLAVVMTHRFKLADGTDPRVLLGLAFESVRVPRPDGGSLDAWFIPARGSDQTIVICHGAGANKGNFIWFVPALAHNGWNLVMFDFRAHGGSSGRVCTYGLHEREDVRAVVDWLRRDRPEAARVIVGLGSSLGSMALLNAAAEDDRIAAVVLDSPFVSLRELMLHHAGRVPVAGPGFARLTLFWMQLLTGADFRGSSGESAAAALGTRPVLVIHGEEDVLMPAAHAQRLHDAARGPRAIWFGPGPHSNIITTEPEEYAERLFKFLREHVVP